MVGVEGYWWVPIACANEHGDQRKERHLLLLARFPGQVRPDWGVDDWWDQYEGSQFGGSW